MIENIYVFIYGSQQKWDWNRIRFVVHYFMRFCFQKLQQNFLYVHILRHQLIIILYKNIEAGHVNFLNKI